MDFIGTRRGIATIVAFILVLTCVLAGGQPGFLQGSDIVTLHLPAHEDMRPLLSIHVISFCRGFQKASDRQGMIETYCSRLSIFFRINKIQRGGSSSRLLTAPARIFSVYPRLPASHFDTTPSMMELFSIILSTLCVGAASFIASIISSEFVYLINNDGNPYGVSASHGDSLSNISWIATSIQSLLVIESLILVLKHKTGYLTCEVIDSSLHIHQP
ncbi:hypothetical protein HAV15_008874 [Penicillium sp. str. |nr:hypothetical protein HAV15_008874 [Penicillium sp. str. \